MARAIQRYFHYNARRETTRGDATRGEQSFCGRGKGGSSLSHAKLVAGESRQFNVSVIEAVPIAVRGKVDLCMMVGDVARVFHEK
jgi:hypothetical protein